MTHVTDGAAPARPRAVAVEAPAPGGEAAARRDPRRYPWLVLLPAVLTAVLAFRAGGFFPGAPAVLAVVLLLGLVGRVTLAERPVAGWGLGMLAAAGPLVLLAVWTLLSAQWSGAPFRALSEFDRTLAYALVVLCAGAAARRAGSLDRALRWLALAIGAIALVALATRLFPATFTTNEGLAPARLAFPLTYWNALGVLCAVGLVLALHATAGAGQPVLARLGGAAIVPVLATTAYFTFSRGAIGVAALGVLAYCVLGHPRRGPVALLAAGLPAAVALRAAYGADRLATDAYASATGEARSVAITVALCAAAAVGLRALGLLADARVDRIRVTRAARRRVLLAAGAVGLAATVAANAAADLPGRLDDQRRAFVRQGGVDVSDDARDRFTEIGSNGRVEQWRVARRALEREPLTGTGAGTFRVVWQQERPTDLKVNDGHSLYFETAAELGWPGLLLVLAALLVPLGVAARRLLGPERTAHAAFLAAGVTLAMHAGIDWDWEMPALFAGFFGLAGIVCAAPAPGVRFAPGRVPRVVLALALLLLALGPLAVARSQAALDRATHAFRAGDCPAAVDGALDSLDALRVRPDPFELLGYCDLRLGARPLALANMRAAATRDPDAWQFAYGVAVAQALTGADPRPMARRALRLNPRDQRAVRLERALRRGGPARWAKTAARAPIPYE